MHIPTIPPIVYQLTTHFSYGLDRKKVEIQKLFNNLGVKLFH